MSDGIVINQGTQSTIATDDVSGTQFGIVKIDVGGDGISSPFTGTIAAVTNLAGGTVTKVEGGTLGNLISGTINSSTAVLNSGTINVGTFVMPSGTITLLPNLPQGSINVTAGTIATLGTMGTLGLVNTVTTVSNLTNGSIKVTAGTEIVTSGSINVIAGTVSAGTINTGTINLGTIVGKDANAAAQTGNPISVGGTDSGGTVRTILVNASGAVNVGTLSSLPNLPQGSITVTTGTVNAGTINAATITEGTLRNLISGTINAATAVLNSGTINVGTFAMTSGTLNVATISTLPNLPQGSINVTAGTITAGTINTGTINNGTVQVTAGTIIGTTMTLSGTTAAGTVDVIASTDVSGYKWISIQTDNYAGTANLLVSNDNINFGTVPVFSSLSVANNGNLNFAQNSQVVSPVFSKYLKVRMAAFSSGTATITAFLSTIPSQLTGYDVRVAAGTLGVVTVGTVVTGTLAALASGTITAGTIVTNGVGYSYNHQTAAGTTVIKASAGTLHSFTVNQKSVGGIATLYDNASGTSSTVIAALDTTLTTTAFIYDAAFANGLVLGWAGNTGGDVSVTYR